jgi:hypothetical protein
LRLSFCANLLLSRFFSPGFQKKGVSLHLLNNAFLLDLPLEAAKGAFNGFSVENSDFCQNVPP